MFWMWRPVTGFGAAGASGWWSASGIRGFGYELCRSIWGRIEGGVVD